MGYIVHTFNSTTQEVEAGICQVQGQLDRQSKFQVSLSFILRSDLSKNRNKTKILYISQQQYLYFTQI